MSPRAWQIWLFTCAVLAVAGSCAKVEVDGKSPLELPHLPPDSVVLDIFFVRFPFGDSMPNRALWQELDEQHFTTDARRQLDRNGFRVGLVGGHVPVVLSQLMELTDDAPTAGQVSETCLEDMESTPRVVRRHKQLRAGKRCEIVTSGVYDEVPVVFNESAGLCGQSYDKAQGILSVKAFPMPDGRVRLELVPELHYGDAQHRYVGNQGVLHLEAGRPRRVFDEMTVTATLSAGQMLVLSSLDCRPGSLGHYFFTQETAGQLEQKLLVVRLSQTQHDDLFNAETALVMGE